jgi:hypothetical protein
MSQKPNAKCDCNSNLKYKHCCFKLTVDTNDYSFETGSNLSFIAEVIKSLVSKKVHTISNYSNYLTAETYKSIQIGNYSNKTIMLVQRSALNELVFLQRNANEDEDILLMYNGCYFFFDSGKIDNFLISISRFIKDRDNCA